MTSAEVMKDHSDVVVSPVLLKETEWGKSMGCERARARQGRPRSWRRREEGNCREMLSHLVSRGEREWRDLNQWILLSMVEREDRGQG